MSAIRAFLARAVPWPTAALPGFVNIHWTNRDKTTGAFKGLSGNAYTDHITASNFTYGMLRNDVDLYVCMSLQAQAEPQSLNSSNRLRRKAVRGWNDVVALRGHWVDVDVKPGFFATTADARLAFDNWRIKAAMPAPTFIVSTGSGGFHVHWTYDDPVARDDWLRVAYALQQALKVEQFPCDYNVVVNPVCILRIPGTKNHKVVPPGDVDIDQALPFTYPFDFIDQQLAPYRVAYALPVSSATSATKLGFKPNPKLAGLAMPPLDAGLETWAPTIDEVASECEWIRNTLATAGAGKGEPEWWESIKVAVFCWDSEGVAHDLSHGHDDYDEAETDKKHAQAMASHGGGKLGWPQCRTINAAGAVECVRCLHFPDNKSPFNYALPVSPASPPPPPPPPPSSGTTNLHGSAFQPRTANFGYLPPGFRHTPSGTVEWEVDSADPKLGKIWESAIPMPFYDLDNYRKSAEGQGVAGISFKVQTDAINVDEVHIRLEDMADNRKLSAVCGAQNFAISNPAVIRKLGMSFREQLWARSATARPSEGFGWSTEKGQSDPSGFCYGGVRYSSAGDTPFTAVDLRMGEQYQPVGSLDYWKTAASLITNQNRPDLTAIIAAAFASPLIKFTGLQGIVLSVYSNASGIGKTHAMRIAHTVWGDPGKAMGALDDTSNYVNHRVSVLRNLPFFYDELRQEEDAKKMVTLIFAMGQGKSKGRLSASAEARDVFSFSTMLIIASNNSLMSYINDHVKTTAAGINRVFEVPVRTVLNPPGMIAQSEAQRINGGLADNYGVAGEIYSKYLGHNIAKVKAAVAAATDQFEKLLGANRDERFWIAAIAVLYLGATYANHLGLTSIDLPGFASYLIERFKANRSYRTGSIVDIDNIGNALRYVQDFYNANLDRVLVTDTVWLQAHKPPATFSAREEHPMRDYRNGIVIRIARNNDLLRLSMPRFSEWLKKERGVQRELVFNSLLAEPTTRKIKSALGMNTSRDTAREDVLELDLTKFPNLFG